MYVTVQPPCTDHQNEHGLRGRGARAEGGGKSRVLVPGLGRVPGLSRASRVDVGNSLSLPDSSLVEGAYESEIAKLTGIPTPDL